MTPKLVAFSRTFCVWTLALVVLAVPLGLPGCATDGGGGGGGSSADDGDGDGDGVASTEAEITNLQNDATFSGLQDMTVAYAVPATATLVEAFYVATDSSDDPSTFRVLLEGLLPGSSQFTFNTGDLDQGTWLIGVRFVSQSGASQYTVSTGSLSVEGTPQPVFFEPETDKEVLPGGLVSIIIDLGDPEAEVAWRAFYIREDSAPDPVGLADADIAQLGNELDTGTGNAVSLTWNTTNVALGTYLIGISATDSGFSVSQTVLNGDGDRIITRYSEATVTVTDEPSDNDNAGPTSPTVEVTEPAANLSIYGTQTISVVFSANTFQGTQDAVEVFTEDATTGDRVVQVSGLTTAATSGEFSSAALEAGIYRVGVTVDDGVDNPVSAFAPGTISIVTDPSLEITSPDEDIVIRPTETVSIMWITNVASDAFEATVAAELASGDGSPIEITAATPTSAAWSPGSATPGLYNIKVRLVFEDTTVPDLSATADGQVRVSTSAPMIWMGCVDADDAPSECGTAVSPLGVIFEGVQFEDNLGSAFAPAGDMDGDGNDDFLMSARYGKPFFSNPDGIGHGEGYLVYGSGSRLSGSFNVNTLGTKGLRGVTFPGIRTKQGNTETDGLGTLLAVPDVDGDGRNELIFGFPNVQSRGHNVDARQDGVVDPRSLSTLEREDQFLRGGIVMVSSSNSILTNPDSGTPVINLDLVGQRFDRNIVDPEPEDLDEDAVADLAGLSVTSDEISEFQEGEFIQNVVSLTEQDGVFTCEGDCIDPQSDDFPDANNSINYGFARALSRDYFSTFVYAATEFGGRFLSDASGEFRLEPCFPFSYCLDLPPSCNPFSPGLHAAVAAPG